MHPKIYYLPWISYSPFTAIEVFNNCTATSYQGYGCCPIPLPWILITSSHQVSNSQIPFLKLLPRITSNIKCRKRFWDVCVRNLLSECCREALLGGEGSWTETSTNSTRGSGTRAIVLQSCLASKQGVKVSYTPQQWSATEREMPCLGTWSWGMELSLWWRTCIKSFSVTVSSTGNECLSGDGRNWPSSNRFTTRINDWTLTSQHLESEMI